MNTYVRPPIRFDSTTRALFDGELNLPAAPRAAHSALRDFRLATDTPVSGSSVPRAPFTLGPLPRLIEWKPDAKVPDFMAPATPGFGPVRPSTTRRSLIGVLSGRTEHVSSVRLPVRLNDSTPAEEVVCAVVGDAEYLTTVEAAEVIGKTDRTVRRWVASGRLPSQIVNGRYLIRRSDAEAAVESPAEVPLVETVRVLKEKVAELEARLD